MEEASYKIRGYLETMSWSFPLKLHEEDEVWESSTREKLRVCGFLSKGFKHGKAWLALGKGQFQARKRGKKNAHFSSCRERERLVSMEGLGVHYGAQLVAYSKPKLALKSWLKRWRVCVCVCVCAWVAQPWSFPWKLGSFLIKWTNQPFLLIEASLL